MMLDVSLGTGLSNLTQVSYCAEPAGHRMMNWVTNFFTFLAPKLSRLLLVNHPLLIQKHLLCSPVEHRSAAHQLSTVPPADGSSICVFSTQESSFDQILRMNQKN